MVSEIVGKEVMVIEIVVKEIMVSQIKKTLAKFQSKII